MQQNNRAKHRHLLVGAQPPPIGGTTVLFEQLTRELVDSGLMEIRTIDSSDGGHHRSTIRTALRVGARVSREIYGCDSIGFHASVRGIFLFGPILYALCLIFRKRLIVRTFGGDFDIAFGALSMFRKWFVLKTVFNSDVVFFETQASMRYFLGVGVKNCKWHPNSRVYDKKTSAPLNKPAKRFVFLGHVKSAKGIDLLLRCFANTKADVSLVIYGPIVELIYEKRIAAAGKVEYGGILQPEEVNTTLNQFDALVLPTFYEGEGYPGVILEAYANGLPVIASRWRAIPEIVEHERTGLLVEPQNVDSLVDAVERLHCEIELYQKLAKQASNKANTFDSKYWSMDYAKVVLNISNSG